MKTKFKSVINFTNSIDYHFAVTLVSHNFEHVDNTNVGIKFDHGSIYWWAEVHSDSSHGLEINLINLYNLLNTYGVDYTVKSLCPDEDDYFTPHVNHSSEDEDEHCPVTAKVSDITRATNNPSYRLSDPIKRWRSIELPFALAKRLINVCNDLGVKYNENKHSVLVILDIYCTAEEEDFINGYMDENF